MTFIEFFDKTACENICACLTCVPEKMVLLGSKYKQLTRHAARYSEIFAQRGQTVNIECKSLNKNNLNAIVEYLSDLAENEECAIGLTGGEELFLTAAGIVFEKYKNKGIQLHKYSIKGNTVYDCDNDGNVFTVNENSYLSVQENVRIYGGDVLYGDGETHAWNMSDDFADDIRKIWSICKEDVKRWNFHISSGKSDETILDLLEKQRLIKKEKGKIIYKNNQVRKILSKSGLSLEMIIYLLASEVKDEEGNAVYNDVQNGVCIDWDGIDDEDKYDTKNEIDVMLMHGMIPVFISCKNGSVTTEELYKLNSVASKFGGEYAKKVLVATALDQMGESGEFFRRRALDMNIRIIDDFQHISEDELKDIIKNLWCN